MNLFYHIKPTENSYSSVVLGRRQEGAIVIENLTIPSTDSGEVTALLAEFKISLNAFLKALVKSPVRSLADVIAFNKKIAKKVP